MMGRAVADATPTAIRWSRGRRGARGSYRQTLAQRVPRAIPEELYEQVFAALTSNRDRAIISLLVSSGARAAELLGMRGQDVDWGGQRVRLLGKGTRQPQWVAASPAFFWLARYLAEQPRPVAEPLWVTLRQPTRPLGYQALRAVLLRVNAKLDTNLMLHDFRHTCALRLAADPLVPLADIQAHLRHRHLSTTETYLIARPEEVVRRMQAHQQAAPPHQTRGHRLGGPISPAISTCSSASHPGDRRLPGGPTRPRRA
jgi:integrase/recombinase XerD